MINETALRAHKLSVRLKRNLDKAEKNRQELCDLLCGAVTEFGPSAGLEGDVMAQIIAPKDED